MITTLEPLLRKHPLFREIDDEGIHLITGCAKNVRYSEGETVARLGEPADVFFLIREGRIALEMPAPRGGALRLQTAEAGEIVGFSWLVPPHCWHHDLRAVTELRAFSIDGQCLRRKCEEDTDFGYHMMKSFSAQMADRLEATRLQLMNLYDASSHPE